MATVGNRGALLLYSLLVLGGGFSLSYFVIGQDMMLVFYGVVSVLMFVICFFSVKTSLAVLVFSMLLSPEIVVGSTLKRDITLRFEDILLSSMTLGWIFRMAILKDVGFIIKTPLNKNIFAFCILAIISTAIGIQRGNVNIASGFFFTLKFIEFFFIYIVVVNNLQSKRDIDFLLNLMLTVWVIICLYGLFQVIAGGDVAAPFEGSRGERNTLSGYLVLLASTAAGVMLYSPNPGEKRILGVFIGISFIVLLFSISRSGWVAASVSAIFLFVNAPKKNIFFIVLLAALVAMPFMLPDVVYDRVEYTFKQQHHSNQQVEFLGIRFDTSTSARILGSKIAIEKFIDHPFLGYGVTGFAFIDGQFVRILLEMGTIGLISFLWLLYGVQKIIRESFHLNADPRLKGMTVGFHAGFWGLIAHALSANSLLIVRIAEPFWCLAGLTTIMHQLYTSTDLLKDSPTLLDAAQPVKTM